MDPVAEIKARLPIDELVGQYCQIQKKGRNFVCLCPFHNDTHPSLLVSPEKGIAYCFACQSGGDIFSFYMKIEGVEFPQAIKDLAEKTGVKLPKEKMMSGPTKDEKERLRECLDEASLFYRESLKKSEKAMLYLETRKVPAAIIESFMIGFAPDSYDATYTHLLKKGFSRSEIQKAGLGIQKDLKDERMYDRFRNRIAFPIQDAQGNLIGFGGRTLGEDDAKYINSPDGPLYNKSVALFGLSYAKEAIRQKKTVILVEGYFDVLAFHRIGIENVVAVSGTALTPQHVTILKRIAEQGLLSLDRDTAGEDAARRAFMLMKNQDMDVRILRLPVGKDPDECANAAPEEMRKMADAGGVPYIEWVLSGIIEKKLEKRDALALLLPLLSAIPSAVEREDALIKTASTLGTTVTALEDDLRRENEGKESRHREQENRTVLSPFSVPELLLGLLLVYPHALDVMTKLLEPEQEKTRALYHGLKALALAERDAITLEDLPEQIREYASVLALYAEEHFGAWSDDLAKSEIRKFCLKVNRDVLKKKQQQLIEGIRSARVSGKKLEEEKLLTQYQQVMKLSAMAQ